MRPLYLAGTDVSGRPERLIAVGKIEKQEGFYKEK